MAALGHRKSSGSGNRRRRRRRATWKSRPQLMFGERAGGADCLGLVGWRRQRAARARKRLSKLQ